MMFMILSFNVSRYDLLIEITSRRISTPLVPAEPSLRKSNMVSEAEPGNCSAYMCPFVE
jgi:hypothetical protein